MAKPQPKPTRKSVAKKPTQRHAIKPTRAAKPRQRESAHHPPAKKKARAAMTTATEPRGAGSGENAVATRGRHYDEKPKGPTESESGFKPGSRTKYEEGDVDKGRIDPEELTQGQVATQIATRDRRAYLIDQAERNEAANDELNAIQVEQNKRLQLAQNLLQDPDVMREESMVNAVASLKMHDPEAVKERQQAIEQKRAAKGKDSPADKRTERTEERQNKRTDEGKTA